VGVPPVVELDELHAANVTAAAIAAAYGISFRLPVSLIAHASKRFGPRPLRER
jgi:hypothetical protein